MINSDNSTPTTDFSETVDEVLAKGEATYNLASGQKLKVDRLLLLQNYQAILHMAGIEQMLCELLGLSRESKVMKTADPELSKYADVPAYWVLSLGELIKRAHNKRLLSDEIIQELWRLKEVRDRVLHGESDTFGKRTRKAVRMIFEHLRSCSKAAPTSELQSRIRDVESAKAPGSSSDEMLRALKLLLRTIESEREIRQAMHWAGILKGKLPLVESIFEMFRATPEHQAIFQRDGLTWKFRASALVRNHLVHGSIIIPNSRHAKVIDDAYELLGQTIAELKFKRDGGRISQGHFRNGIGL